ncbi:hypothetical protein A3F66_05560 [candidate division TM6 bacterium RIFCSPHIGHO2_12_FULL_32_22]|nr:MAG: hypothetical protein A3F66_05560 [candidate division TM6 bacterium RIFCSPHIGHO2_12_FULL_32_22]
MKKILLGVVAILSIHADMPNISDCQLLQGGWKEQFSKYQKFWFDTKQKLVWQEINKTNSGFSKELRLIKSYIEEVVRLLLSVENDLCSRIYLSGLLSNLKELQQELIKGDCEGDIPDMFNTPQNQEFFRNCEVINGGWLQAQWYNRFRMLQKILYLRNQQIDEYELIGTNFPRGITSDHFDLYFSEINEMKESADCKKDLCSYLYIDGLLREYVRLRDRLQKLYESKGIKF